ncbi:MAG: LacI family DNA-binding transcriptional regulator [Agathobacter sp.]|uniref:LacI family DNA-binding transcriptional regulator n=1 Tax=Agathobacter sp. TaxID=2021311 RepID=UPI0025867EA6|nr:LacI family DNA-binding transcriptional regulator [Agathobacter sp.]MCR5676747.1 LacI family DNA-binding transcriptional regulator [Agathobacter sp.]
MNKKRVTVQDIADELGLSRNTVSKAINGTGSIAEDTKQKIFQTAAQLGYKQFAMPAAIVPETKSSPILPRHKEISLFTHTLLGQSHFGSKLLDSFQQRIGEYGYILTVYMIRDYEIQNLCLPINFNPERSDGIMCLEVFSESYSQFLSSQKIPLLFVDTVVNHMDLNLLADCIYMENRTSSYRMLKSLVQNGCKHISFVGDRMHCHSFYERWSAYCQIHTDYNLQLEMDCCILDADSELYFDLDWLTEKLKALPHMPEAFFCANDSLAIAIMKALRQLNYKIPDDVMVCGFDNSTEATVVEPPLTTVQIPSSSMGYIAADTLISRIDHPATPFRTTYIKTDVIFRESTKQNIKVTT